MHQDRMRRRIKGVRLGEGVPWAGGKIWSPGFFAVEICRIFQMQA